MPAYFPSITAEQADLIHQTALFFVATVDPDLATGPQGVGPLNLSPKGGVPLHIINPNRVAYLDYAASGNETARHTLMGGPITIMVCSFEPDNAAIIRLYGTATALPLDESDLAETLLAHPATDLGFAPRQVIDIAVESTMISCGYGVPVMHVVRERRREDRGRRYKGAHYPSKHQPV